MAKCADMRTGKTKLSGVVLLASIMRLRQACCDPALLPAELLQDGVPPESAKTELLQEILMQSLDSGHKILVFSQFTSMLKLIRTWMENKKIPFEYLDGTTKDRQKHVDNFNQSPDIPVFLLSLKAGGVGLNLTSADTVILCDPWWNPAAENQATDRTHRIGQTKNVNCIRLAVKDSIEVRVLALQQKKRNIFQSVVEDAGTAASALTLDDFEFLLGNDKKS
jgi:SNF2 family DNA or RNA helicase